MTPLMEIVEGWTAALPFTLDADDVPIDLTGMTVQIVLRDNRGNTIKDTSSGITVTGTTSGQLEYAPSSVDFLAAKSPYRVRFRVTDALSKRAYWPSAVEEDLIAVGPV